MYEESDRIELADELADAFLDEGRWCAADLAERAAGRLDRRPRWLDGLAFRAAAASRAAPIADRPALVELIDAFLAARPDDATAPEPPRIVAALAARRPPTDWSAPLRRPVPHESWATTPIASVVELAERLELSVGQLEWLADARGLERSVRAERLRNYRYRWLPRRTGPPRLVEAPKLRLKEVQRWVLREILAHVPVHDAAHGFVPGRSVHTHAALHTGRRVVVHLDLRDFFLSIPAARVAGIFRSLGYPPRVRHALTGLCTNAVPPTVWAAAPPPTGPHAVPERFHLGRRLAFAHLPQGAPTSPALANLVAFGLDRRLTALAARFGLRYSRYADDLTFSGGRLVGAANRRLLALVTEIVAGEGFGLNEAKTSLRTSAQRQVVTGVVVNERPNVARADYDRLRATLHRLAVAGAPADVRGPGGVDRRAQLAGQVAWVASLNAARGVKLRRLLGAIEWAD